MTDSIGHIEPPLHQLFNQAKSLQTRFRQITTADTGEIFNIQKEAQQILSEIQLAQTKPMPKKLERKCQVIQALCTSVGTTLKSCRLQEQAISVSLSLLNNPLCQKDSKQGSTGGKLLDQLSTIEKQLKTLELHVSKLLDAPPEPASDDPRLILMRRIQGDRFFLTDMVSKAEKITARQKKDSLEERGIAGKEVLREAFHRGEGDALVSLMQARNSDPFIRDPRFGPQMKTEETRYCEQIFRSALDNPDKIVVFEREEGGKTEWYIKAPVTEGPAGQEKIVEKEFNLRELVANADFSQIQMSDEELEKYANLEFVFPPDSFEERLLRQIDDPNRKPPLTKKEKKALLQLSPTQKRAINNYTKEGTYSMINSLLRGQMSEIAPTAKKKLPLLARGLETQKKTLETAEKNLDDRLEILQKKRSEPCSPEQKKSLEQEEERLLIRKEALARELADIKNKIQGIPAREALLKKDEKRLVLESLLHAMALGEALSHLPDHVPPHNKEGRRCLFRCDRSLPQSIVDRRIAMAKEHEASQECGFLSTSDVKPSETFFRTNPKIITIIEGSFGKLVAPLAEYDQENEVLLPPTQIQWMAVSTKEGEKKDLTVFWGRPIRSPKENPVGPKRLKDPSDSLGRV